MAVVNNLLSNTLYKIGWRRPQLQSDPSFDNDNIVEEQIEAEALLMKEDSRMVLVVDQEFENVPAWVEYNAENGDFSIVMTQGQVALLSLTVPNDDLDAMKLAQRLLLITNVKDKKLMHFLPFLLKG